MSSFVNPGQDPTLLESEQAEAEAAAGLTPEPVPVEPAAPAKKKRLFGNLNMGPRFGFAIFLVLLVLAIAFIGPLVYDVSPSEKVGSLYDAPGNGRIFGTDNFGYDVLAVLMHSTRNSLFTGLMAGTLATSIGVLVGVVAGFVGGWFEEMLMGLTNVVLAIPSIVVLILISVSIQSSNNAFLKGIGGMALVIGITAWPWTARAVRAQASSIATREHIDVARLSGARLPSILAIDVLPYLASYIVMAFVLQVASAILAESALSLLGLGPSGTNSLGIQLHWALAFQAVPSGAWWAFLPPTIVLTLVAFGLLMLQSSLDEVFNPRLRRGKKKDMKAAAARRAEYAKKLQAEAAAQGPEVLA